MSFMLLCAPRSSIAREYTGRKKDGEPARGLRNRWVEKQSNYDVLLLRHLIPPSALEAASESCVDELDQLLGRTLIIVAHPDDEAVACAALIQRMREPYVLFCTDGGPLEKYFWERYGSRHAYSLMRQEEARVALSHVNVKHVEFLRTRADEHIIDQQLFQHLPEATEAVSQVVSGVRPQALLTLAYEGGHPDHDSCNFITSIIARERSLPAWEMPIEPLFKKEQRKFQKLRSAPQPAIQLHPTAEEIARKHQVLAAYASQGNLAYLDSVVETFRPLPAYDYARLPHEGVLNYEAWHWSMTGKQVCAAFEAYLASSTGD
jgi:N-acetylglucosamine malate deacetylase 2